MRDTVFFRQAELLLRILPLIHKEEVFALKGGTAINFFIRDLPRLSVDIDLTYLPLNERDFALDDITHALIRVSKEIERKIPGTRIVLKKLHGTNTCHPRPMIEILSPQPKDIRDIFEKEFKGMIAEGVTCEELEATRDGMVSMLRSELTPR